MTDAPVRLGSILFTLVEPHRGFEVAYNRWAPFRVGWVLMLAAAAGLWLHSAARWRWRTMGWPRSTRRPL